MKKFRKDEGFTLIELMVVVLIIGILVAIAIPVFQAAKGNAQKRSCFANERTVEGAIHSLEASVGTVPPAGTTWATIMGATWLNAGAATDSYIATEPKCPSDNLTGHYSWTAANQTINCNVHGHF